MKDKHLPFRLSEKLWDLWCIFTVVGIWPRFIEPNIVTTTKLSLPIPKLPKKLEGLKILQFSDLHISPKVSDSFLRKLQNNIQKHAPDLIVFTGDFLCYSYLNGKERLKKFLNGLHAPLGCYAIFGNHDYEKCVSVNDNGDYDPIESDSSTIVKGFQRLFKKRLLTGRPTETAKKLNVHQELVSLLKDTSFELLDNRTKALDIGLNITGVGEHMLGKCLPEKAFQDYDEKYPGIILAHNPDCIPSLKNYPGQIILSGHTHGAQVNLPWIWKKFVIMENMQYKRGLFKSNDKWIYVNRGVGSVLPFRWFSVPELLLITLTL